MATRTVLVTGGASGIGYAAAQAWADAGLRVVISDIDANAGAAAAERIRGKGGDAGFVACDVSDANACRSLVRQVAAEHGRLDIAFNNAGIAGPAAKVADCPTALWRETVEINLFGIYYCLAEELKIFSAQGHGIAINMASVYGKRGVPGGSAYSASKHAVIGLTKSAALEYGRKNIRINALCPGFIETPLIQSSDSTIPQHALEPLIARSAQKRYGLPEEVAKVAVWLASDAASYVNGAAIDIDGGFLAA